MDGTVATKHSINHETLNDGHYGRAVLSAEQHRDRQAELGTENMTPILMPSGLNSMLKNTTETGDIGIFSIRHSRLPRHPATSMIASVPRSDGDGYHDLQKQVPSRDFRLFNVPSIVDDRKRLPSYSRDITSEIASLYDNTSQKSSESSRFFEDPDRRSYSMTHTSTSGSRLASHRSYASLRSQADQTLAQRPRSPFPYPSRLKRPGFRPCSPALTDGGVVDYSRRAEIERGHADISILPSQTLSKQKGAPRPLSIRSDINRSTPAVMALVATPGPFKQLPRAERSNMVTEWTNDIAAGMGTASRERSNVTLASTANLHPLNRAPLTTTPGKLHSPSPLYYDYTENFCNEYEICDEPIAEETESLTAPPFLVERTIHEDRELSSDWSYLAMTDLQGRGFLASESLLMVAEENTDNPMDQMADMSYTGGAKLTTHEIVQQRPITFSVNSVKNGISSMPTRTFDTNKGPTGREIDKGLYQTPGSASAMKRLNLESHTQARSIGDVSQEDELLNPVDDSCSNRGSHCNLSTNLPVSPNLPDSLGSWTDSIVATRSQRGTIYKTQRSVPDNENSDVTELVCPKTSRLRLDSGRQTPAAYCLGEKRLLPSDQDSVSFQEKRVKPDQSCPMEHDLTGLAKPVKKINSCPSSSIVVPSDELTRKTKEMRLNLPWVDTSPLRGKRSCTERATLPEIRTKLMLNKYKSDGDLRLSGYDMTKQRIPCTHELLSVHGDEHRKLEALPLSGIISPMPIYPARELRVKNSIPQLMDSLTSLPLRKTVNDKLVSMVSGDTRLPVKTSPPFLIEKGPLAISIEVETAAHIPSTSNFIPFANSLTFQTPPGPSTPPFLSRFRFKSRSPAFRAASSPTNAAPPDFEQGQWDDSRSDIHLPPVFSSQTSTIFTPKLKLKLARSSMSSLGTVRINRGAGGQTEVGNSELLNPRDLFTSSSGLTTLFRQVSRHFHSKERNINPELLKRTVVDKSQNNVLSNSSDEQKQKSSLDMRIHDVATPTVLGIYPGEASASHPSINYEPFQGSIGARTPITSQKMPRDAETAADIWRNAAEIPDCSSEDISRLEVHHTRKKIPSLKSLFQSPYVRTTSRQSWDGNARRPKVAGGSSPMSPSGLNTTVRKDGSEQILVKGSQRLKNKATSWLKAAKATMLSCMRSRKTSDMVAPGVPGGTEHP